MLTTIKFRRGTYGQWTVANPVLGAGEPGFEIDSYQLKIGDGETPWNDLPYLPEAELANYIQFPGGGSDGQVLTKSGGSVVWSTPAGGGGGGSVVSVNGEVGEVVLTIADIEETPEYKRLTAEEKNQLEELPDELVDRRRLKNQPAVPLTASTDKVERFEIVHDGTSTSGWPNRTEFLCTPVGVGQGGTPRLVQYFNEYFEWRGVARKNTVLWRAFVREFGSDPAHDMAVPITEIQDNRDHRNTLHAQYGNGDAYHKGNLVVDGTINGQNIGIAIEGVYEAGSEPTDVPEGTIILVRS